MENYFNYFTEIEEHFQKRRETLTLLSPLDWALIESFQEAGVPLEVVLRGIDIAFEKHTKRNSRIQKVNSLSYCTQAILGEFERLRESSVGKNNRGKTRENDQVGEREHLIKMITRTADQLQQVPAKIQYEGLSVPEHVFEQVAGSLQAIEQEVREATILDYEQLELRLCTLEEKILAVLVAVLSEDDLLALRTEIGQELNRHRRGLKAEHLAMLEKRMMKKKLLEKFDVPRLSLFYLPLN
jgi:hypothetical protein